MSHSTSGARPPDPNKPRSVYFQRAHADLHARLLEWETEWRLRSLEFQGILLRAALERNASLVRMERGEGGERGLPVVPKAADAHRQKDGG